MIRKRTITLSDEEWEALGRKAASLGMSRHAYFRRMAQAAMISDPPVPSEGSKK